ncbi:MAG: ABC transporter permease [Planctomycetota bacterium]|jgi:peptide/nickel transport system permease protein
MADPIAPELPAETPPAAAGRRKGAFRLLLRDRGAVLGLVLVVTVVLMALLAPLAPYGPAERGAIRQAPTGDHWLGTDQSGYDVFSRLLYGARLSLLTGIAAVALSLFVGVPWGALSGYAGGWVDGILMRITDVMLAFPSVVLAIAIATLFETRDVGPVIVAVGVVAIPTIARQVRGSVLQVKNLDFITAARAMGMSPWRILARHVLPNCLAPIIVLSTLGVGFAILSAAGLNFLGLGPEARVAEWGVMLKDGYGHATRGEQWVIVPPGVAIAMTVLGFNLLGDGLRRALDPRTR